MNAELENVGPDYRDADRSSVHFWLRQVLVGNPFYMVSAAFLLYGIYRVSMEPRFLDKELQQLAFNFSALQVYELLLTFTALFLARRRIWYDSTLLVVIESSFVLVPFLLVSQAISLSKGMAYLICGLTALLAAIKFSTLKTFYPKLNFPPVLLYSGALILAVNGLLPLLFKSVAESNHAALVLDVQEAGVRLALTGILPLLAVLAVFLPRSIESGDLPPQKKLLPLLIHFLWITATAVHFYSIRYVYKTPFEVSFFAPTAWVLAWVLFNRTHDSLSPAAEQTQRALLILPAIIALPIVWPGKAELSGYLLLCNLALYAVIYFRERTNRVALHLTLFSLAAVMAEVPKDFWQSLRPGFNGGMWALACVAVYLVLAALISRNPKVGLAGAICVGAGTAVLFRNFDPALHFGLQTALGFALMHSITWKDFENPGAKTTRILLAAGWMLHSFLWTQSHGRFSFLMPATVAAVVVIGYFAFGLLRNIWASRMVLFAAAAVLISTPASYSIEKTRTAPLGVLCVVGSFLLFAVGTWFALSKSKWFEERPYDYSVQNMPDNPPE